LLGLTLFFSICTVANFAANRFRFVDHQQFSLDFFADGLRNVFALCFRKEAKHLSEGRPFGFFLVEYSN